MKALLRSAGILCSFALSVAGPVSAATPLDAILTVDNTTTNPGDVARVRVVHNSPDAPAVDVWVNGGVAFANLPFAAVSDYAALPPGTYNVQVVPAGAVAPVVIDADLTVAAGTDYTVVASDLLAEIFPAVLVDDNSTPANGNARLRFFHGSPDAPAVDIALIGGPVLVAGAAFGDSATLEVPAGSYDLEVRVAGTTTEVLQLRGVALAAGSAYSAFASGLVAQGSADRTAYLGDGGRFRVDVTWQDFAGRSGVAKIVDSTGHTGLFWFFEPANVELLLKVLDGRDLNDAFWVYWGSASNVAYTVTVTDTVTGQPKVYQNGLGTFGSGGDVEAFPQ